MRQARLAFAGIGLIILAQLVWLPPISRYALTYYNPLLGGAPAAQQALLIGWGEGLESAGDFLNQLPNAADLASATLYSEPFRPNFRGRSLPLSRYEEADFLVHYVNMDQRDLLPTELETYVDSSSPVATVDLVGVRFAAVYALPRPEF
jgi:hypothetical protein